MAPWCRHVAVTMEETRDTWWEWEMVRKGLISKCENVVFKKIREESRATDFNAPAASTIFRRRSFVFLAQSQLRLPT